MKNNYLNIYNNLIKLTRNKNIYYNLKNNDTFSDRLVILLLHFSFFLKIYKNSLSKEEAQDLFDFIVRQIELSIREIGYGDVSVNKKMKDYVNLFYSILEKIENWDIFDASKKTKLLRNLLNILINIVIF
jgi:cytochrome b pre-mRNA-processing protein 3